MFLNVILAATREDRSDLLVCFSRSENEIQYWSKEDRKQSNQQAHAVIWQVGSQSVTLRFSADLSSGTTAWWSVVKQSKSPWCHAQGHCFITTQKKSVCGHYTKETEFKCRFKNRERCIYNSDTVLSYIHTQSKCTSSCHIMSHYTKLEGNSYKINQGNFCSMPQAQRRFSGHHISPLW